jgi:hypothetical protein
MGAAGLLVRVALLAMESSSAPSPPAFVLPRTNAQGYPLFVHSPYVSWWLRGGDPTNADVWHVKQDKRAGMSAMVRLPGPNVTYRLLGTECTPGVAAFPGFVGTTVHPTRTVFEYHGLGLDINLTFATPVFLVRGKSARPLLTLQGHLHVVAG